MTAEADTIMQVVERTCEMLAFMFPMLPDDDPPADEATAAVRVDFSGPVSGYLLVTAPRRMLPALASNMLGLEPDEIDECAGVDALKELGNVICGNLLPALAGPEPVFRMSPPRPCDAPAPPDGAAPVRAWLDEGWVEVAVCSEGGLECLTALAARGEKSADSARIV